ncbi:hypothetical protein [Emticicia sp. BO119]|uniref:hypothetical protein n=1 Tax=Emticicia sp. BO119 TaxID=2757768 RepID=UPI0015F11B00|nr:hypothetical protein [Emticicia sp. BO119]MBA4852548.1 hypothetical protein [Emticicia sp. BO119]
MKTKFLLGTLFFIQLNVIAAIVPVVNGDNLQTKINNAVAGDVLMVGAGNYGNISVNKALSFIGTGYFLPGGGPGVGPAVINGTVEFTDGSSNSIMTGFQIQQNVYIGASNVTFSRNFFNASGSVLYLGQNIGNYKAVQNVSVKQCYILASSIQINGSNSYQNSNYLFKNNIIEADFYLNHGAESSGAFINNTFAASLTTSNGDDFNMGGGAYLNLSFYNNIFGISLLTSGSYLLNGVNVPQNFKYNVLKGNGTPEQNAPVTNLINQDNTTFFAGYPGNSAGLTTDARNILGTSSPARDFGRLAPFSNDSPVTDAGAFGGDEPYVLSGIPTGPYVYEVSVPPVAANNSTIQIKLKAKTNN